VRPHQALDMQPPASRFTASVRVFVRTAMRWEYPSGSDIRQITASGMLSHAAASLSCCKPWLVKMS
jgi:hypothetical protein